MIIATIKKLDGTLLDHGRFATEQDALAWFQPFIDKGVYGRQYVAARQETVLLNPEQVDEQGNVIIPAEYQTLNYPEILADFNIEFAAEVKSEEELRQEKIQKGKAARQACENVLDLIGGYNIDNNLTFDQKNQMKATMSNAKSALNDFQPSYAKYFINQITPDGVLITEEMKSAALALLSEY